MIPAPPHDTTPSIPAPWRGLFHDTSCRDSAPDAATLAARLGAVDVEGPVGALAVTEEQLPDLPEGAPRVRLTARGGAGVVGGTARLATRRGVELVGLDVALRDEDDLAANARRVLAAVDAARADGDLDEATPVHLVLPAAPASYGWLAALDVAAEAELGVGLRPAAAGADEVVAWIDAALDRATAFVCVDGPLRPVHDPAHGPGFANLLLATAALWEGEGPAAASRALTESDPAAVADLLTARGEDLLRARRWLVSVASPAPDDLPQALALLRVGA